MSIWRTFRARQSMWRGLLVFLAITVLAELFTGCGGTNLAAPKGNTNVMVLMTSTANDNLVYFFLGIASVTLTDSAGQSVVIYKYSSTGSLVNNPSEWMHLNGFSEPLVASVSVPQGTYTSATLTAGSCTIGFLQVVEKSGESYLGPDYYSQGTCTQGTGKTTVNLPSPISIRGTNMVLSLNLQVSKSYTLTGTSYSSLTMSPVFTLTPVAISSLPTNELNGKMGPIFATVSSVNSAGNSFEAQTSDGVTLNVICNNRTTFQDIEDFGSLTSGMIVETDLAIQPDLSLLATRVEAPGPLAAVGFSGPLDYGPFPSPSYTFGGMWNQMLGCNGTTVLCDSLLLDYPSPAYGVSGEYANLLDLPFAASLSASSLFLGQNLHVFSPGNPNSQGVDTATTVTLAPQTIDGTVGTITSSDGFTVYNVTLSPHGTIPTAQQWECSGCFNPLTNSTTVTVYVDANTQLLNSTPIKPGGIFRFTGLIFDDNGVLRMDCGQVLDGVSL